MSDAGPVDFRTRFLKLLGYGLIACAIAVMVWAVLVLGGGLFGEAAGLRCRNNLRSIMEAMVQYGTTYSGQLPPTLAQLLPYVDKRTDRFHCPQDPNHGVRGCRPAWLRKGDGNAFAYADLDGPTMDADKDRDTLPCSYLYAANGYPCGLADFKQTWREVFAGVVEKFGKDVPIVRCYYHLPEKYLPPQPEKPLEPDPDASPTYNITADLEHLWEYKLDWQSEERFSGR